MSRKNTQNQHVSIIRSSVAEYLTFVAAAGDNETSVEMRYENENIWLTQSAMAELFDVNIPAISKHLSNIYEEGELVRETTLSKMETVQGGL